MNTETKIPNIPLSNEARDTELLYAEKVPSEFSIGLIISKVDFTEPWIIGLIAFHCIMLSLCVTTKSRNNVQVLLFALMLALVYLSDSINEWAALNWNKFSKQQYFDSQGFFISIVYSVPLLFNCLFMIGQWLYQASDLMLDLRKLQLRQRKRKVLQHSSHASGANKEPSSSTEFAEFLHRFDSNDDSRIDRPSVYH